MADHEGLLFSVLDNLSEGVYFTDGVRQITFWNRGAEQITGYRRNEVLGSRCQDNILMHVDETGRWLCTGVCPLAISLARGIQQDAKVFLRHKEGHRVAVLIRVFPILNSSGKIVGAAEVFSENLGRDILASRLAEMERLALVDELTGLPNRRYLERHLHGRLEEFRRHGLPFGVLFMDIDHFKAVNDAHGHEVGDRVLRMVGRTLDGSSRPFDIVGRWGGEEFLALIAGANREGVREVGERFRALVETSGLTDPDGVTVTLSAGGVDAIPEDTLESLIRRADLMLYRAKQSGRNQVCI
jgi:diguanylate cyclase (GGDEF)-like protein/PAS domain S-box-containing protein